MELVPLSVLSSYSLLQSPTRINDLVTNAQSKGYHTLALTDRNVLYGLVDFDHAMRNANLRPIFGITIVLPGLVDTEHYYPIVCLAKNQHGYHQLLRLSTAVMTNDHCQLTDEVANLQDMFVLLPPNGELSYLLLNANLAEINHYLEQIKQITKPHNLYYGVSADEQVTTPHLQALLTQVAGVRDIPLVALDEVQYLDPQDALASQAVNAIRTGEKLTWQTNNLQTDHHCLLPMNEAIARYCQRGWQEAVLNTQKIATACQVKIPYQHETQLPHFPVPTGTTAPTYLRDLAQQGLQQILHVKLLPDAYQQRLNYELNTIINMGFADYFLIVWDVMNYAHQQHIMTGPGRGSAAGSLVAYALHITVVDPLKYHLLFERFLNPNRTNMPDIDLDIPDDRRDDILQYVHQKYGDAHMSQIITFGTMAAKMVLRDMGRIFGLSKFEIDDLAKMVPSDPKITLRLAYQKSGQLQNFVHASERNRKLFEVALKLEGLPRHYSTHAAGILLSDQPLVNTVALQTGMNGIALAQLPKEAVAELGLLKIDFLGLRNLTILAHIVRFIKQTTHQNIDVTKIPLNDAATLSLFQRGDTNGIFQFESNGIKSVLRRLHPTTFEDIVATNALYRPGPIENIDTFIARKNHRIAITYPHPLLKPILASTYGVLVYQEQVMQVASVMGNFSLGEADLLRRAMSKKKKAVIDASRQQFLAGAKVNKIDPQAAALVYQYIERFANYGFNRSHAVAYSMLAFWLAYLKVHYPLAFFTALLNSVIGNLDKVKMYITEARQRGIKILPPDVNRSQRYFSIIDNNIIFGLLNIKGMRRDFVNDILQERVNGPYHSLTDFLRRIDKKWLNEEMLTSLIYSGAFDRLNSNRAMLIANLQDLLATFRLSGNNLNLFTMLKPKQKQVTDLSIQDKLLKEAQYLGLYLSAHPVDTYRDLQLRYPITLVAQAQLGQQQYFLVLIKAVRLIKTKNGEAMAFIDGQDASGDLSITVFPDVYRRVHLFLQVDKVVLVNGKVEERHGNLQVVANNVQIAKTLLDKLPLQTLFLRIDQQHHTSAIWKQVLMLLTQYHGNVPVIVIYSQTHQKELLSNQYAVTLNKTLLMQLKQLLGQDNIAIKTNQTN